MKNSIKLTVLFLGIIITNTSIGAAIDSSGTEMPAQVSFISPMGTNGLQSLQVTNNLSINIFAGMAGGLNGVELGGFANVIKNDMHGVQLAGFTNVVLHNTKGAQLAGYFNYSGGKLNGTQLAGFANVALDSVTGGQLSGYANVATKSVKGTQLAGYANTVIGNVDGAQFAGFANVATGDVSGGQVSGFVNYAKKLNGIQLGIINICDTVEKGVSIGFLSLVRRGFHEVELGGSASLYGTVSLKTGTEKFYNIFSVGVKPVAGNMLIGFGYGVGTSMQLKPKLSLMLENVAFGISDFKESSDYVVLLNQLSLVASYNLTKNLNLKAGPTFNTFVSVLESNNNVALDSITPYSVYNKTKDDVNVQLYPGAKLAIGYKF